MDEINKKLKDHGDIPVMADFGLDDSAYQYFRQKREYLNDENKEIETKIQSIRNNTFFVIINAIFFMALVYLPFLVAAYIGFNTSWWYGILAGVIIWYLVYGRFGNWIGNSDINNILTFGKYNRLLDEKKESKNKIEKLEQSIKNRLSEFENALYGHYKDKLDNFYSLNLYNKRSGNQYFEDSLVEFDSMINSFSQLRSVFLTGEFDFNLWEYRDYLRRRMSGHVAQTKKVDVQDFNPINEFIKKATRPIIENIKAPEEKYRTPRKIDWESINKNRIKTGLKGEEIIFDLEKDYLISIGKNDLADKVGHISVEKGDGSGYDILSFFPDGREKYIEVKSTTKSLDAPYYISSNEISFLKEYPDSAFIYRIVVSYENEEVLLKTYSSVEFFQSGEIVPFQYIVKTK